MSNSRNVPTSASWNCRTRSQNLSRPGHSFATFLSGVRFFFAFTQKWPFLLDTLLFYFNEFRIFMILDNQMVYDRLDIKIEDLGESFYQDKMIELINFLKQQRNKLDSYRRKLVVFRFGFLEGRRGSLGGVPNWLRNSVDCRQEWWRQEFQDLKFVSWFKTSQVLPMILLTWLPWSTVSSIRKSIGQFMWSIRDRVCIWR